MSANSFAWGFFATCAVAATGLVIGSNIVHQDPERAEVACPIADAIASEEVGKIFEDNAKQMHRMTNTIDRMADHIRRLQMQLIMHESQLIMVTSDVHVPELRR